MLAEPAKAETLLEDLSEWFRHVPADHGDSVILAHETALARRYLEIEQIRFGDRLRVQLSLDPGADQARLPPLGSVVVITVSNSVPGGPGAASTGKAPRNVRERV